eukprot:4497339-Amphidinium_carterae.1
MVTASSLCACAAACRSSSFLCSSELASLERLRCQVDTEEKARRGREETLAVDLPCMARFVVPQLARSYSFKRAYLASACRRCLETSGARRLFAHELTI